MAGYFLPHFACLKRISVGPNYSGKKKQKNNGWDKTELIEMKERQKKLLSELRKFFPDIVMHYFQFDSC